MLFQIKYLTPSSIEDDQIIEILAKWFFALP